MNRSTMVYKGTIDKLTDESVRSIFSQSIRGLSLAALASAQHELTCSSRACGHESYNVQINHWPFTIKSIG
jgi:hypothetical protein